MKTTRREFLATAAAGAGALSDPARRAGQGRHEGAGARQRRLHLRSHSRLGRAAATHQVGQYPRRRRRLAGQHLRASHGARDERQRRHDGRVRSARQVRAVVGERLQGRRARAAHPQGRQRRVSLPDGQRLESEDDAAAGAAGGAGEDDDAREKSSGRLPVRRTSRRTNRAPTARRSATTRPTSRSRRTAMSTSATATARTTSISTTARRSTSGRSAARDPRPDS